MRRWVSGHTGAIWKCSCDRQDERWDYPEYRKSILMMRPGWSRSVLIYESLRNTKAGDEETGIAETDRIRRGSHVRKLGIRSGSDPVPDLATDASG